MIVKLQGGKNINSGFVFNGLLALASMFFFVVTETGGFSFPKEILFFAVPSAICYCIALIFTYLALSCGSFAISIMILSYSIVFPIVYGIVFLHEKATMMTYMGFAVIAVSLYLTRGDTRSEKKSFSLKWLIFILLSSIGNGMFAILKKMQQLRFHEECNNEFMILTLGFTAIALFLTGMLKGGGFKGIKLKECLCALGAGFANGITNMLTLIINTLVAISVSSPINTGMKIILSFVISGVILHERFLKRQLVGVALGTLALILLNF